MTTVALPNQPNMAQSQNDFIGRIVAAEGKRLRDFIRKRVPSDEDAEDIVQDVFYEFIEVTRLMKPIERAASWLYSVARNKIIDRYRKKKTTLLEDISAKMNDDEGEALNIAELVRDYQGNADKRLLNDLFMDAFEDALAELPAEQRDVFVANEIEGIPFVKIAEATGTSLNTLLSRKRYAVLHLRQRLKQFYSELGEQ